MTARPNSSARRTAPPRRGAARRSAFTLVEVMISVALVLLIVYGVSQVFKISSDAAGTQAAVSNISRDHRAAFATLSDDFRSCVPDPPLFLISNRVAIDGTNSATGSGYHGRRGGFANPDQENNDPDKVCWTINDSSGAVTGLVGLADLNDRIPRLDRLGFFTNGLYRRQTTNNNKIDSAVTSREAYVWIGHSRGPRPSANNSMLAPNDQYASERILARYCILLRDPNYIAAVAPGEGLTRPQTQDPFSPLYHSSGLDYSCRQDLVGVTIDQLRADLSRPTPAGYASMDEYLFKQMEGGTADIGLPPVNPSAWRAFCDPKLLRPISAANLSRGHTAFLAGCTQFVVEYAGDFLNQDPKNGEVKDVSEWYDSSGKPNTGVTDGMVDFVVDTTTKTRQIRWYGLPRDSTGDGVVNYWDVLPLRNIVQMSLSNSAPGALKNNFNNAAWEFVWPPVNNVGRNYDFAANTRPTSAPANATTPPNTPIPASGFAYVSMWKNSAPLLVRISLKVDDPTRRLRDGMWYDYVLTR